MKKNIVFFIQNFSRSAGSERVTSIIANLLSEQGYNITILSICGNNTSFYDLGKNIRLVTLFNKDEISNKKYFFKIYRALKKFYSENKVDLVIDIFAALSVYTLLLKKKFKFKNITWEHFNFKVNTGFNKFGRRYAAKKSDYIVTLTEKDKQFYLSNLPKMKAKIVHIYNPSPYEDVKTNNFLRENIAISVGRLTYQKGFDVLLNIWSRIEKIKPEWKLQVIGSGEESSALNQIVESHKLQNVEFVMSTNKIDEYYQRSKIYLSTARFEGLPMTMIEAQSFGLPIISFDYDTGPSDIIRSGYNGYLVENGNIDKFCSQLVELMNDDRLISQFSENSVNSNARFKSSNILVRWLEILKEIL